MSKSVLLNETLTLNFKEKIKEWQKKDDAYFQEVDYRMSVEQHPYYILLRAYTEARSIVRDLELQIKLQGVKDGKIKDESRE